MNKSKYNCKIDTAQIEMTQSNIFVCSEKYVALWHILPTKVPLDRLPKKQQLRIRKRMISL